MSPQDYEYLLMALDLARMDKRWGFSILVMKWKVFLEGYLFSTINCDCDGTFEVDRKKMDIDAFIQGESSNKRKDIAFIRIGVLHAKSPRKIEMQKDSDGLMISSHLDNARSSPSGIIYLKRRTRMARTTRMTVRG